jgi:recombinational DNA repair protein RecR
MATKSINKQRTYTEIRINHKGLEEKQKFETELDQLLKSRGYNSRAEWIREKYRELKSCRNCGHEGDAYMCHICNEKSNYSERLDD